MVDFTEGVEKTLTKFKLIYLAGNLHEPHKS